MKERLYLILGLLIAFGLIFNIVLSVSIFFQQDKIKKDLEDLDDRLFILEDNGDLIDVEEEYIMDNYQYIEDDEEDLEEKIEEINNGALAPEYGKLIKVIKVIDGDTIQLENNERLRYIGIDTPEKVDPRKPIQCFAYESSQKNKELVEGKMIKFYKDISERDDFNRLLGYVYLEDGTFVNMELVKQGYAFSADYPPDISKKVELDEAENYARLNKFGLWNDCTITTADLGNQQTNSIK